MASLRLIGGEFGGSVGASWRRAGGAAWHTWAADTAVVACSVRGGGGELEADASQPHDAGDVTTLFWRRQSVTPFRGSCTEIRRASSTNPDRCGGWEEFHPRALRCPIRQVEAVNRWPPANSMTVSTLSKQRCRLIVCGGLFCHRKLSA